MVLFGPFMVTLIRVVFWAIFLFEGFLGRIRNGSGLKQGFYFIIFRNFTVALTRKNLLPNRALHGRGVTPI